MCKQIPKKVNIVNVKIRKNILKYESTKSMLYYVILLNVSNV